MDFSTSSLMSGILISCLGGGLFLYGKKAQRLVPLLIGILMCIYPCFVSPLMSWGITAVLIAVLYQFRGA